MNHISFPHIPNFLSSTSQAALAGAALVLCAGTTNAQDVHPGDVAIGAGLTVQESLCVGAGCTGADFFGPGDLHIKDERNSIYFDSTSTNPDTNRDWGIFVNSATSGEYFTFYDYESGTDPFSMMGGAPTHALHIRADGNIGMGTSGSAASIHITRGDTPNIRFEQDGSGGQTPQTWDIIANETNFYVRDQTNNVGPFYIYPGTGNEGALTIGGGGRIGMGTYSPSAQLHVTGNQGQAQVFVEETSSTGSPRTLMNLQNNGRPEIVMGNTGTGGEWSFGAGTNFILKQGAVGSASSAKTKLFQVNANGDAVLTGSLTTGGTTCGGGCDLVFSDSYDLPSISEHAEAMFALGHLPNVGPTPEDAPINVSDKLGRMLNELEHAHIYIARQEARIARLEALVLEDRAARD